MRFIVTTILITFLATSFKANSQPAVIVGTAIGEPGDTVSIPIDYIGTGSGVVAFQVDINFDNANLTVGLNCNTTLGDAGIGCVDNGSFVRIIVFGITNNPLPNGQIGTLNFTISSGVVVPTNLPLSISNEVYSQANGVGVPANGSADGLITVEQLFSVGGDVSGLGAASVTMQNNLGDNLTLSANGPFVFSNKLADLSPYSVSVLNHPMTPDQTCTVSGGGNNDGSGNILTANVSDIQVLCNDTPILIADVYAVFEDSSLVADDANGSINDANDDSVLVNDSDDNPLTIVTPGVFDPIAGIGGELTINSNGTFEYTPPENAFGIANFTFEVTDGASVVSSELTIDVMPVNDAPTFDIFGNIDATPLVFPPNAFLQMPGFVNNINLGEFENGQIIQQYIIEVISDSSGILDAGTIVINALGGLELDLTLNEGIAFLRMSLQDDGGIVNGGEDTSTTVDFSISYIESIFVNGFEEVIIFKLIDSIKGLAIKDGIIEFRGHYIELYSTNNDLISIKKLKKWVQEIEVYQSELF